MVNQASFCPTPDCSYLDYSTPNYTIPPIQPNPDVSGVGVLIGFVGTAILTWLMVVCYYVCDCVPTPEEDTENPGLSQVDHGFLNFIWRWKKRRPRLLDYRKNALEDAVLMFSDLQVMTSLAILAAGFSQLHCGISSYHWQIMVYTAWFSSVTHLTTLTVIRHYFRRNNPRVRIVRVFLMFCTIVMLVIALLPTGNENWIFGGLSAGVPAICYFRALGKNSNYNISNGQFDLMVVSMVVLLTSYVTRVVKLFSWSSRWARTYMRTKPARFLKGAIKWASRSRRRVIIGDFFSIQLTILRAAFDFAESMFWEIQWLLYALIWGSSRMLITRNTESGANSPPEEEKYWNFSQLIAVFLLFLPILSISENLLGQIILSLPISIILSMLHTVPLGSNMCKAYENAIATLLHSSSLASSNTRKKPSADTFKETKPKTNNDQIQILLPSYLQDPQENIGNQQQDDDGLFYDRQLYNEPWFRVLIALINLFALELVVWVIYLGIELADRASIIAFIIFSPSIGFWVTWVVIGLEVYGAIFVTWEIHKEWLREVAGRQELVKTVMGKVPDAVKKSCGVGFPIFMLLAALTVPTLQLLTGIYLFY